MSLIYVVLHRDVITRIFINDPDATVIIMDADEITEEKVHNPDTATLVPAHCCHSADPGKAASDYVESQVVRLRKGMHMFDVDYIHTGKFEATYSVFATSQEEADQYVAEHHAELEPKEVMGLCDDYERYV